MAGSGMCTGGRIKHHLANNISRPENTVLFVGYQARVTLGRELLERPGKARIHGEDHAVRARIEKINGFSAHADRDQLLRWVAGFTDPPQHIVVIHGEKEAAEDLASLLREHSNRVEVPGYLEEIML